MNIELLIDSINIITEKSQTSIEQVIRKDKPVNEILKFVSLYLNEMKSEIFEWICNILNSSKNTTNIVKSLSQLKKSTDQELTKHRLHILLKKKLKKLKKQSFLHSMDSHGNFFNEESRIEELEKSVLHIEKDLNIEPEQEDSLAISSIIQKSRMYNFDQSAVKDQHNVSTVSEYEILKINFQQKSERKENQQLKTLTSSSAFLGHPLTSKFQVSESFYKERKETEQMKQNEQKNIPEPTLVQISQKTQIQQSKEKIAQLPKVMKKKKKSVYSTTGQSGNLSKQDLLGNILEECLQNENK